jgi:3',5'-cyclic AMP phosphodiesterase CpdA
LATSLIAIPSFIITITSQTASASPSPENFTIVALPDTQYYSESYPWIFENQTKWIVQNKDEKNIVFVAHLGDIIEYNDNDYQWQNADNAMSILDGKVPYGILPGNHDLSGNGAVEYEKYFPASRYEGYSYWGGSYDSNYVTSLSPNMNNYQLFSAGGMDFIALNLQNGAPIDVLDWADNVLDKYSDRRAIISTHMYLDWDGSRMGIGELIWENLVVPHKNVFLVLCGHIPGEAERSDNLDNRTVYQLLSDYQSYHNNGGNGWLRIMEFVPSENKICVKTYSPYLDQYWTDSYSQFELSYPMNPTVAIAGGPEVIWPTLLAGAVIFIIIAIAGIISHRLKRI